MRRLFVFLVASLAASGCETVLRRPSPAHMQPAELTERRTAFAQAYDWFRHGNLEDALPEFAALVRTYPQLADHSLYFAGVIHERQGDDAAAEESFGRLLHDYPRSIHAPMAALELGKALMRRGKVEQSRPWLQSALADKHTALAARLALAEADERSGDVSAAYSAFMAVRQEAPTSAVAHVAKEHVLALRAQHPDLVPVGAARLEEARLLLAEHDYAGARDAAVQLSEQPETTGDPRETTEVMRVLADALYGLGEVSRALAVLRRLVDVYPESAAAPDALRRLGTIRWNRDDDAAALQDFDEFRRLYPRDPHAADVLYAIGRIHEHAGQPAAALAAYAELTQSYPQNTLAPEARFRVGWIHYRARDWSAAAASFASLSSQSSSTRWRNEAEYWQARSLEHAGHAGAAKSLYQAIVHRDPNDYYAMWAEQGLRNASWRQIPAALVSTPGAANTWTPVDPGAALAPEAAPQGIDPFHEQRWRELKAAGVDVLARRELAAIEHEAGSDTAQEQYLLRAYPTVEGYAAAIHLLQRLGGDADLSQPQRERLLYPLAFWTIVSREASTNNINPLLVVAIMRQESLFNPDARSPADAIGLLQLLPSTAKRVASFIRGGQLDPAELTDPDVNIQLGTRHLAGLLARFQGDALKAVAAYNGGEAAAEKWQTRYADLDPDEFVESITFRETRDYVKKVVSNYRTYQQLYRPSGTD